MCGCGERGNLHKPPFAMDAPFTDKMKEVIQTRIKALEWRRITNPASKQFKQEEVVWEKEQTAAILNAGSYRTYFDTNWMFKDVLPHLEGPQGRKIDRRLVPESPGV